jgi:serine protease Do
MAALTAAGLLVGTCLVPQPDIMSRARAQTGARPVGFADIVDKVKPAVMSVRVKIDAGKQTKEASPFPKDSPLDRFFRRFAQPDTPDNKPTPRGRNFVTGQGSGFFISADGYAVTNFHVVEKANNVEVTADDGRIFNAKVIGVSASISVPTWL